MVYTIQIDTGSRQNFQYMFDKAEDRDELYDKLIAALSPGAIIDSAPGMPATWAELARQEPQPKPKSTVKVGDDEMTLEELRTLAMAQMKHLKEQAALAATLHPTS